MNTEREVHIKEFQTKMFVGCFNECFTGAAFNTGSLNANEAKCLKNCYVQYAKRFEAAGQAMGYNCKLTHNFE
jgi:hypothetical protein